MVVLNNSGSSTGLAKEACSVIFYMFKNIKLAGHGDTCLLESQHWEAEARGLPESQASLGCISQFKTELHTEILRPKTKNNNHVVKRSEVKLPYDPVVPLLGLNKKGLGT